MAAEKGTSLWSDAWRRLLKNKLAVCGLIYLVALVIIYLILVAIFSHWGYPLLIMATIPLGIASGIVGLWLMNWVGAWLPGIGYPAVSQSFDMITMLGFLILMGTVVNNPILIVHQAMINVRNRGMAAREAVRDAVAIRLRPIAMTSVAIKEDILSQAEAALIEEAEALRDAVIQVSDFDTVSYGELR